MSEEANLGEWTFSYYDQNGIIHEAKGLVNKQAIISEFVNFFKRNESLIIKDVDTIGFIIRGLEEKGFQYILDDKKEWEEMLK